jgi:predicted ATPase/DNA-binding CsgD family transcriptional regulator
MARPARREGNLPAETTSFIGRRRELAEIRSTLADARLISLVGPGGVGKTRLAMRVAADLARSCANGAWLVELGEVVDPALVGSAAASALGLRDQVAADPAQHLLGYLRDRDLLLVVDNCEHLLEAAARLVSEVLKAAPGVRVIATSREPLSVAGEHLLPVPPLDLPGTTEPVNRLRQNEAVALFTERAGAASGTFGLTSDNAAAVADLCRRLDGLPLAIELAAVRTRALTTQQILDRLADRFTLLTGGNRAALPRHQTLRTTIEWSHDLLTDSERAVLRRACVFAGRFTLDDVEGVCVSDEIPASEALDVLASLVDKSLVTRDDVGAAACYRLHETMREFAALKLSLAGENDEVWRRCTQYYWSRCAQSSFDGRYRLLQWLEWAELEIDNIRAVLQRCLTSGDDARGLEIAVFIAWYWITRATSEGVRWLDEYLARSDGGASVRGWALFLRGFLPLLQAESTVAQSGLHAAVTAARQQRDAELLAEALAMASIADNLAGDQTAARKLLAEAHDVAQRCAGPSALISVLQARALNGMADGNLDAVRAAATAGIELSRQADDVYSLEMMLLNLGSAALVARDLDEALPLLADALRIAQQIDDRVGMYYLLASVACHAAFSGQAQPAARLMGAAYTVRTEAGANVMPFLAPLLLQAEEAATEKLGRSRFEAVFQAGQRLDRDAAVALALGERAEPAGAPAGEADTALLAPREADVARLVADGLTNKQIGARLFISERTVDSHMRSIMNKLGFSSRAQIAAWIRSG